jgi:hypothetical protein
MDGHRDSLEEPQQRRHRLALAIGGALIALGGHLELIRRFGTSLPFRDQWKCTGQDLLGRWVDGQLTWRHFFEPLNDHLPVLTRALSFAVARLNGQWNNLVEITGNALLHAVAVFIFLLMVIPALGRGAGACFAIGAGVVLALPITWENTLWGIQSLVYLQILLSLIYLGAIATRERFDAGWFVGQAAGLLVLATQHSGILAEVAAVPLLGWRLLRSEGSRVVAMTNLVIALMLIGTFFALIPPMTATVSLRADSWQIALDVALRQLAWPIAHPAGALLLYLPWLVFATDRLARRRLPSPDALILAAGFWVGSQAAAIGYGRAVDAAGFVSRYCDFLSLGLLLNAACLFRLWANAGKMPRLLLGAVAAAWALASVNGLWRESRHGHAGFNLERRHAVNAANLAAVSGYLASHDPGHLTGGSVPDTLYTYPPTVKELLDKPGFRAFLPPETGAAEARQDQGRLGTLILWLPRVALGFSGVGVALVAGAYVRSRKTSSFAAPFLEQTEWTRHRVWFAATGLLAGSVAVLALWPGAWNFERTRRWADAFAPPITRVEYVDVRLRPADPGFELSPSAPIRAVATIPVEMRLHWQGTLLGGSPDFQGILRSADFKVPHHHLFVPVSGWPNWPGNGLRWRFQNPVTSEERWVSFMGQNPVDGVAMWEVPTTPFLGWRAALFLYDGGTGPQGWVGVGRPAASNDGSFGREWLSLIHAERAEGTHRLLAAFVVVAALAWAVFTVVSYRGLWLSHWRRVDDPAS